MYLPSHFEGDRAQATALIRQHPFASLVSVDKAGLPFITHLPLHLEGDAMTTFPLSMRSPFQAMSQEEIRIGAVCSHGRRPL